MLEHVRIHINHCAVDSQEAFASLSEFFDVCGQDAMFAALASRKSNKSAKTGVGSGGFDGEFRV